MASSSSSPNCSDFITCGAAAVGNAVSSVQQTVDFWTDPWGNTFTALQSAAHDLAESVLPTVTKATLPDLSAAWFVQAYAVAFAMAIFVAVVLLIPQFLRTARGMQSGRELAESVGLFFPLFLLGAMFGPPAGVLLVNFFGSLSNSIAAWGIDASAASITARFQGMLTAKDAVGIAGGAPVGVLLMLLMICGLLLVIVMLVVQLVTLYFTGVLLPLGLVWIIDAGKRRFGTKIITIWLGVLASHPLLFFLLSVAYLMVADSADAFGSGKSTLTTTVQLIVSVLALFMAGLTPLVLTRLAPVIPFGGAGSTPRLAGPSIGALNLSEVDDRLSDPPPASRGRGGGSSGSASGGSGGAGASTGAQSVSDAASRTDQSASSMPAPAATTSAGAGRELVGAGASRPASGAAAGAAQASSAAGGAAAASGATGAAAGAGEAAAAAGGLVAAGAGESATGVGAAIGVPTVLAGVAVGLTAAAVRGSQELADTVGQHAVAPVDDHEIQSRRNSR